MSKVLLSILLWMMMAPAHAIIVFDAANFAQNKIAAINSVRGLLNQVKELEYQFSVYQNDLKHIARYAQGDWGSSASQLKQLAELSQRGQALTYQQQNLEIELAKHFPGYHVPNDFAKEYQSRSQSTLDTLKNSFAITSAQAQQMQDEIREQQQLQTKSTQAQGQLQAVQTANMYADAQIGQAQKLRQLVMTQMNAQNAYYAYQVSQDQAHAATVEKWIQQIQTTLPRYGSGQGFGRV